MTSSKKTGEPVEEVTVLHAELLNTGAPSFQKTTIYLYLPLILLLRLFSPPYGLLGNLSFPDHLIHIFSRTQPNNVFTEKK